MCNAYITPIYRKKCYFRKVIWYGNSLFKCNLDKIEPWSLIRFDIYARRERGESISETTIDNIWKVIRYGDRWELDRHTDRQTTREEEWAQGKVGGAKRNGRTTWLVGERRGKGIGKKQSRRGYRPTGLITSSWLPDQIGISILFKLRVIDFLDSWFSFKWNCIVFPLTCDFFSKIIIFLNFLALYWFRFGGNSFLWDYYPENT